MHSLRGVSAPQAATTAIPLAHLAASFVIHSAIATPSGPSPIARNLLHAQTLP